MKDYDKDEFWTNLHSDVDQIIDDLASQDFEDVFLEVLEEDLEFCTVEVEMDDGVPLSVVHHLDGVEGPRDSLHRPVEVVKPSKVSSLSERPHTVCLPIQCTPLTPQSSLRVGGYGEGLFRGGGEMMGTMQ